MSIGNPIVTTYSSGFGALALQLKQTRENFCCNWSSLDWGKREWPPIGTIGEGGVRGVKMHSVITSKICYVACEQCAFQENPYCEVFLTKGVEGSQAKKARIRSVCNILR